MAVVISGLKPIVTCPATLYLPDDGGVFFEHKFTVDFKRLTNEQREALHQRFTANVLPSGPAANAGGVGQEPLTSAQLLDEIVEGWGGMLDGQGQPVPYSSAERRATDSVYPGLEQAMVVSWYDHFFKHQREAALKNSAARSGTTSAATTRAAT